LIKELGIEESRVIYVGKEEKEVRVHVTEAADLVRCFFRYYKIKKDCVIFSDNGHAFQTSMFKDMGYKHHYQYPAVVHQYLSPNDNLLHGTAKQHWRTVIKDFHDDVKASLTLLHALDRDIARHSRNWFKRNILELSAETVEEVMGRNENGWTDFHNECLREYRIFCGDDAHWDEDERLPELQDRLDGQYWE